MKKVWALLVSLFLICLACAPVFAEGITIDSGNGDRVAVFENARIDENTEGTVVVVFGDLTVDAPVDGDVIVVLGDIAVNSRVSGQVVNVLGTTVLAGNSVVDGNVISMGTLKKEQGSRVLGQEVRIYGKQPDFAADFLLFARVIVVIVFSVIILISGLIAIAASRNRLRSFAGQIESNVGRKLLMGFLALTGSTILVLLLFITIIAPILYVILLVAGGVVTSIYFGRMILRAFTTGSGPLSEFITGLMTVTLFKLLFIYLIPHEELLLNLIIYFAFTVFLDSLGIGILLDTKYGSGRIQQQS